MVHRVSTIWKRRQQGSAALITTIAVSSILVVLFVGITTIATREIKQSINADNANRALYAAEAGVEDAVRRLADDPSVREAECNALTGLNEEVTVAASGSSDAAWTCRTITTLAAEMTGRLEADESLNINLARGRSGTDETAGYLQARYMKIEWNNPNDPGEAANPLVTNVSSWLPIYDPGVSTPWTGAAALEITSTWFEATGAGSTVGVTNGSINKSGLTGVFPVRTVVASPACTGASCTYSDFSPWNSTTYPNSTYVNPDGVPLPVASVGFLQSGIKTKCSSTTEYSCTMPDSGNYDLAKLVKTEINNSISNQVYDSSAAYTDTTMFLRIRPRYRSASYRIQFFAGDGVTPVYMPDGNATIDVTARSGNYFRRVQAKKQLVPSIYDGVFDNALFSGGDICKNMKIYRDYRGAPDYTWNGTAKEQNEDAGRNDCDGGVDSDV